MQKQAVLFIATTLVTGVIAIYLWFQLQAERQLTARLQPHVYPVELLPDTTAAQPDAAPSVATSAVRPAQPSQPTPQPNSPAIACNASPNHVLDQLMPGYRRSLLPRRLELQALNYPDIGEELGLSQAETTVLLDLLQQQATLLAGVPNDYTGGDELFRQEIDRAGKEIRRMQAAELEALLGSGRFQRWQEYQPTLNARREVARLPMKEMPLTAEQSRSLVTTIIAERRNAGTNAQSRSALPDSRARLEQEERDLQAMEASNARVLQAARTYLSERQLATVAQAMASQVKSANNRLQALRRQLEGDGRR